MTLRGLGVFGALFLAGAWLGGCGELFQGGAGDGGAAGAGGAGGVGGIGLGGAGGFGACTTAEQCFTSQVCDPTTKKCVDDLPCKAHSDCGGGAYCMTGSCTLNVPSGPCDADTNCLLGETCMKGFCGCGGALYQADTVPPNVLIVLDRSQSMLALIEGGTKWDIARQSINDFMDIYGASVRFGLMLYPGSNLAGDQGISCGPGMVVVDPGDSTTPEITSGLINAGTTTFGTPTAETLSWLVNYAPLEDPTRANYILLITDGISTCNDPIPVAGELLAQSPSIKTYVIGFGDGVDPGELDGLAQAGGTADAQAPYYYQADNAAALGDAFKSIAGSVLSCAYVLSKTPPDPNELYVYVDGNLITKDASDGWVYDPATNQITFVGGTCDALKSGAAKELLISYGCPIKVPE